MQALTNTYVSFLLCCRVSLDLLSCNGPTLSNTRCMCERHGETYECFKCLHVNICMHRTSYEAFHQNHQTGHFDAYSGASAVHASCPKERARKVLPTSQTLNVSLLSVLPSILLGLAVDSASLSAHSAELMRAKRTVTLWLYCAPSPRKNVCLSVSLTFFLAACCFPYSSFYKTALFAASEALFTKRSKVFRLSRLRPKSRTVDARCYGSRQNSQRYTLRFSGVQVVFQVLVPGELQAQLRFNLQCISSVIHCRFHLDFQKLVSAFVMSGFPKDSYALSMLSISL